MVGIPSNRAHRLHTCLLNVLDALRQEGIKAEIVVADGSGKSAENQAFADKAENQNVRVLDEKGFAERMPPDRRFLFEGPYGGPRNMLLLEAVRKKQDVVFLDDDVIPVHPFFTRFERHFKDRGIVVGAYAGKRTGAAFLMDKASRALMDFYEGQLPQKQALARAREAFCGESDDWPPSVEGFRAGCLGVSQKTAGQYAFFPTRHRMEDGVYCSLARSFTGQEPFKPFLPEAPVGVHRPEKGGMNTLADYYLDGVQGSVIGLSIQYALEHFGKNPTDAQIGEACQKGPQKLLYEFSPERFQKRREHQKPLDEAVKKLGDAELETQYFRFALFSEKNARPENAEDHVKRFFHVQQAWRTLVDSQTS